eukprot:6002244-Karenia_brevis.AAC.1
MRIERTSKYLGVMLGVNAAELSWQRAVRSYISAVVDVRRAGVSLVPTVGLYNVFAFSKLTFIASFFGPPKSVLKVERKMLHSIGHGPFAAFPCEVLLQLRSLKIRSQARDLYTTSLAARVRNGIRSC